MKRPFQLPTIDVVMYSHNHESFVADALESVFAQVVNARVHIRIHDDASTDATAAIIREKMKISPFPVEFEEAETNQYAHGSVFKFNFASKSSSKYIAFLDADDFWVSPHKLQMQLDLMTQMPDVALCHTRFHSLDDYGNEVSFAPPSRLKLSAVPGYSLSETNFLGTLTVMVRRSAWPKSLPQGFSRLRGVDDYPLWALVTDNANIGYIDMDTAVYRLHSSNSYQNQSRQTKLQQTFEALIWIANSVGETNRSQWLSSIRKVARHLDIVEGTVTQRKHHVVSMLTPWLKHFRPK
jgi:glycosyltransferase involved in cell wall biosynthesis